MSISKTVIISCAGIGSRIGLGHPKALIEIESKPIIIHHLEQLNHIPDIRIVVGYEHERMIRTVLEYRSDVLFVFNHEYLQTNTLGSLKKGAEYAQDIILSLDGDLLVYPPDLQHFLSYEGEILGYADACTEEPVYCDIQTDNNQTVVTNLSKTPSPFEWTGLALLKKTRLTTPLINDLDGCAHVFDCLKAYLPINAMKIDCCEIDTASDLQYARKWAATRLKTFEPA